MFKRFKRKTCGICGKRFRGISYSDKRDACFPCYELYVYGTGPEIRFRDFMTWKRENIENKEIRGDFLNGKD